MAKLKSKLRRTNPQPSAIRRVANRGIFSVVDVGASAGGVAAFQKAIEDRAIPKPAAVMQAQLAAIVESADDSITGIDRDGNFIHWNKGAEQLYGYRPAEILGRSISVLIPPDRADELPRLLNKMRHGQKIVDYETVRVRKDGQRRDVSITLSPIRTSTGQLIGTSAVARDITARKQAEARARESEMKFQSLFENSRDAIMILTPPNWKFTVGNAAAVKMFRAGTVAEFIAYTPWELSPKWQPDHCASAQKARAMIAIALRRGSHFFDWTHQRIDGEQFQANVLLTQLQQDGKVILQATVRDITEQKQAETALRESEARFRVLFDEANDGMLLADGQSKRFLLANRQIQKWLGYSAAELVQMGVRDIHPAANLPRIIKDFERQGRREITLVQNIPMRRKDGTLFYADVSSAQITLQGQPYQLGIFRDVTERKRLESEIQQISETEKQRLGHDLHDGLSQQLTAVRYIASELESALREHALPEAASAAKIVHELSQASKQIHDIARGLCPIELKNWDLVSALEEQAAVTTDRFRITSRVTGLRQIHWADPDTTRQLYRIAQEAITNAGKHSHGQRITIRLVKQPHRIILTVKDDGRGIPPPKRRGAGLGLQIMQYRANLINAELTIDRAPDGGTVVNCVLPTPKP